MALQTSIIEYLKIHKIFDKIITFITMENWVVGLTGEGGTVAEVLIQISVFQGDLFSSLLFLIAKMPLTYVLRKCTVGGLGC